MISVQVITEVIIAVVHVDTVTAHLTMAFAPDVWMVVSCLWLHPIQGRMWGEHPRAGNAQDTAADDVCGIVPTNTRKDTMVPPSRHDQMNGHRVSWIAKTPMTAVKLWAVR